METTIASCFTAVDVALAKLVSPPHPAAATTPTYAPVLPDLLARPDVDTDHTRSDRPAGDDDADEASPPNRFQATTTFNPGSSFPAGNWVSHMRVFDHRVDGVDHGTWRQRDRTDWEEHPQSPSRHVHPTTASPTFGMGALPRHHHNDTSGTMTMLVGPLSNPNIAETDAGICVRICTGIITGHLTTGRLMMTTGDTQRWGGRSNRPATLNAFDRLARRV